MEMQLESEQLEDYLIESVEVDFSHSAVAALADELSRETDSEIAFVRKAFEYVRDHISHTWDIQSTRVTSSASGALLHREGICYAKSMLLCALLRSRDVPAGFCYQRLTLGDTPDTGYVIHALNGVYLQSLGRWVRLDARGNKPGIDAQFSLEEEQLAFPVRTHYEEIDYPTIYIHPYPSTVEVLKRAKNAKDMYLRQLPSAL
ncbi:transglutaminase family protein [Paenibacillus sp. OV219]|uniref:transglutaminase-like domain-containing protein n=1 Tax=Paenibacillus sp. OV219 TaxID=1884377 RepID=UPI0008B0ED81|nr:transglutaminase family protein [Paenibacillus sp. OV219]SEO94599.1 Transglutaminase-like superfamily protein [Paenibacillus sp. OV219]